MSAGLDLNLKDKILGTGILPHRRCIGKLELKVARNYCHQHSIRTGYHDPDAIKETVFGGSADQVVEEVLMAVGENRTGEIPDCPQGLVLHNSIGQGAFD